MENKDAAKERVEQELDELNEKIVKLSFRMRDLLREQLNVMQRYAEILQHRLVIWGKTDKELNVPDEKVCGSY